MSAVTGFSDQTLSRTAMKAELLDAETELALAYAWRDERDEASAASPDYRLYAARDFDGVKVQAVRCADERPDTGSLCWFDEGCG